jgi:hypothetical protein
MKKVAIALIATVAALSVWAQQAKQEPKIIGKLINVTGLVTVSSGNRLSNVVEGAPLIVDDRIITTSTGGVTLDFDNGCDVTLKENESIKVSDDNDCALLWAGINRIGAPLAVATAGGTSSLVPGLLLATGGAAALIINNKDKNKASGS